MCGSDKKRYELFYTKKEECCGCGACKDVCPTGAIAMISDKEGFWYPHVKKKVCINCGKCRQVCPLKKTNKTESENGYLGVKAKDDALRYSSSSGGIFSVLAEYILGLNGIIFGAGYDKAMDVIHQEASDSKQLEKTKKTKYVQSKMEGIYCRIEEQVKKGKWVLFCGTPCQAQALKLFLNKEYERLIIVDLVCYGVPSPGIWKDYIIYLQKKNKGKITDFSFRDKRNHDNGHIRSYVINGKEFIDTLYKDSYCRLFFKDNSLRPSCYNCKFCTVNRSSDITIGDFWGIENVKPDMDDGMGISMMILHTDKAKRIWDLIKKDTIWFACEEKDLLQPRLQTPTSVGKKRFVIMNLYKILPFSLFIKWIEHFG